MTSLLQWEELQAKNPKKEFNDHIDRVAESLREEYGQFQFPMKLQNLRDLGPNRNSILAHHNFLLKQIRDSFVVGNYYPALTGACSLGERVLNHLVLDLTKYFRDSPEFNVLKSLDNANWKAMITALSNGGVLLPEVSVQFLELKAIRNRAIHFNLALTADLRTVSLNAVKLVEEALSNQFSVFGLQPWFISTIPGEMYISKDWEGHPFIIHYYIPNCLYVGYKHKVTRVFPWEATDPDDYEPLTITDEEFSELRRRHSAASPQ